MINGNTLLSNIENKIRKPQVKDILLLATVFVLLSVPAVCIGFFESVQDKLISLGGTVRGHELDAVYWHYLLSVYFKSLFQFAVCFVAVVCLLHFYLPSAEKTKVRLLWIFFALSLLLSFITVVFHEQWYDEVHAFYLAQSMGLRSLFTEMGVEGHFLPWFFILWPFAKLNFPVQTISYISWIINAVTLLLFAKKAPFNPFVKIIVLCTSPFLFWNPVVSRPYVLLALVLFLIAAVYKERNTHPYLFAFLVGILANTHAYIEGLVGILFLYFLIEDTIFPWKNYSRKEKQDHVLALALIVFLVLVAFVQVLPALFGASWATSNGVIKFNLSQIFGLVHASEIYGVLAPLFVICLVFAFIWCFKHDKKSFVIWFLSCLWMWLFAVFIYNADTTNRALLWFVVMLFVFWISEKLDKKVVSFFVVVLALFILNPGRNVRDITGVFASTRQAADYIKENYPAGTDVYEAGWDFHLSYFLPEYTVHPEQCGDWSGFQSGIIVVENCDANGERIQSLFPENFVMVHDSFIGQNKLPLRKNEVPLRIYEIMTE